MLEYPQLTRAIYFTARAGRVIPEELFVAVATVLAFVFQLERAVADGIVPPAVDIPPRTVSNPKGGGRPNLLPRPPLSWSEDICPCPLKRQQPPFRPPPSRPTSRSRPVERVPRARERRRKRTNGRSPA